MVYNRAQPIIYINWSKAFLMVITNVLKYHNSLNLDGIKIGVIIAHKLAFDDYVSQQCLAINRKLHTIKRLFFLPLAVKIQFFKSFILPYYDYCSSLCIYAFTTAKRNHTTTIHYNAVLTLCIQGQKYQRPENT